MKKRICILALLVISAFLLAGCPDSNNNSTTLEFTRGYWYDGVYTNAFANLTFRLPEDWNYISGEQLDEMTEMVRTSPTNPNPGSHMFFDMIARADIGNVSIVITFEPLYLDDELINSSAQDLLDGMALVYQQRPGILYVSEMFDETFGGEGYRAFYTQLDPTTTLTYFARRIGDYMLNISILRLELYDVLSYFS